MQTPACGGDSTTALPRESQKDKRPIVVERGKLAAHREPLDAHLVVQGMCKACVSRSSSVCTMQSPTI